MSEQNKPKWIITESIPDGYAVVDIKFKSYKHQLPDILKFLEQTSDAQLSQIFSCFDVVYDLSAQHKKTLEKVEAEVKKAIIPLQKETAALNNVINELRKILYLRDVEIKDANEELDKIGAPDISPELGHAFVGHRLQWLKKNDDSKK